MAQNIVDLQTARYEDLTAAETPSMIQGITLLIVQGDEDRARRVINLSLDLEHLISVLELDPAKIDPEKLAEVRSFRDNLVAIIGQSIPLHIFGERLTDPQPDPPPHRRAVLQGGSHTLTDEQFASLAAFFNWK